MEPGLPPGSFVLFCRQRSVKRGDVVLVDHPDFGMIVKEVSAVGREGGVHLRGTSRRSTSQKKLGSVSKEEVLGVKVLKLL